MEIRTENRPTLWIAWAAVVALSVALAGCQGAARTQADRDLASKDTVSAFVGALSAEASASGEMVAQREAVMSFSTPGRVERVYVEVGQEVQAGDVLVELESDALQRALRSSEQSLAIQEANLAELRKEASERDVAAAQAALASAEAQLDDLLAGPSDQELRDAEAALASAQVQLEDLLAGPKAHELSRARAALASARAAVEAEAARYAAIEDQLTVARLELDLAAVDLESAKYFYDALKYDWQHKDYADFSPEVEVYKDAQTAYNVALARYNLNAAGIDDGALRNAQSQVAQAEASLTALTEAKTVDIAAAREQIALAEASLAALNELKTAQIAAARAQIAQAEANLGDLMEGASPERLAIAEAQVEQARIQLADAQARVDKTRLIAPFDGVITALHFEVGELSSGPAVEMVDPLSLEVVLDVDEVDIGNIAVGQSAIVSLETWPDYELEGEVSAIAPKARAQSEVVIYQVHISADPGDLPIRVGMTANADLITSRREDVLLVANRAITADRREGAYYVYRREGNAVEKIEIGVGLRDRTYTEVTSGLREGDELVIGYEEAMAFEPGTGPPEGVAVEGQ